MFKKKMFKKNVQKKCSKNVQHQDNKFCFLNLLQRKI